MSRLLICVHVWMIINDHHQHAQISHSNKFAISLQYLKKEVSDKVDFLYGDKNKSLLQTDTMILKGKVKHSQSSQNSKFAMSLQHLEKEFRDQVNFLHGD